MDQHFRLIAFILLIALLLSSCGRLKSGLQPSAVPGVNEAGLAPKDLMVIHSARLEHKPAEGLPEGGSDFFGTAIAMEEGVLAVGAPSASDGTEYIDGLVFIYHKQGDQWIEAEQLSPSDHQKLVYQSFGSTLAFSGDVLYVGAPGAGNPQTSRFSGMVYVYQNTPGGWAEIAHLAPDEPVAHENFGFQLSAQGDTLAVAAGGYQGNQSARVVIFRGDSSQWIQEASLGFPSIQGISTQINSLAIYGDSLVVGITSTDATQEIARDSKRVLIFERNGNEWRGPTELFAGEYSLNGIVALDGDGQQATRLAVGASPDWWLFKAVAIFEHGSTGWEMKDILASPDGGYIDHTSFLESFGASIVLRQNYLLAGVPYSSEDSGLDGVAYLFKYDQGRWICQLRLASPVDGMTEESFGSHVDLNGSSLLIAGNNAVYTFEVGNRDQ